MGQEKNFAIKFLDATLIVAVVTGVFFACGYTFYEGFYGTLHVPMRALVLSPQDILLFGSTSVFMVLLTIGILLTLMALVRALSPRLAKNKWIGWLFEDSDPVPALYILGVSLVFGVFGYLGLIQSRTSAGASAAEAFLAGDCLLVNISYTKVEGAAPVDIDGCFIVSNSGMYWFKPILPSGLLNERTMALPASSLLKFEVEGKLRDIRLKKDSRFK